MDLHPGERVVFEGHPSWRALLSFYLSAIAVAIAVAVVVALIASVVVGVLVGIVLDGCPPDVREATRRLSAGLLPPGVTRIRVH